MSLSTARRAAVAGSLGVQGSWGCGRVSYTCIPCQSRPASDSVALVRARRRCRAVAGQSHRSGDGATKHGGRQNQRVRRGESERSMRQRLTWSGSECQVRSLQVMRA